MDIFDNKPTRPPTVLERVQRLMRTVYLTRTQAVEVLKEMKDAIQDERIRLMGEPCGYQPQGNEHPCGVRFGAHHDMDHVFEGAAPNPSLEELVEQDSDIR